MLFDLGGFPIGGCDREVFRLLASSPTINGDGGVAAPDPRGELLTRVAAGDIARSPSPDNERAIRSGRNMLSIPSPDFVLRGWLFSPLADDEGGGLPFLNNFAGEGCSSIDDSDPSPTLVWLGAVRERPSLGPSEDFARLGVRRKKSNVDFIWPEGVFGVDAPVKFVRIDTARFFDSPSPLCGVGSFVSVGLQSDGVSLGDTGDFGAGEL